MVAILTSYREKYCKGRGTNIKHMRKGESLHNRFRKCRVWRIGYYFYANVGIKVYITKARVQSHISLDDKCLYEVTRETSLSQ